MFQIYIVMYIVQIAKAIYVPMLQVKTTWFQCQGKDQQASSAKD